jgi:hypothetical protein
MWRTSNAARSESEDSRLANRVIGCCRSSVTAELDRDSMYFTFRERPITELEVSGLLIVVHRTNCRDMIFDFLPV